jgi:hypothetical protein
MFHVAYVHWFNLLLISNNQSTVHLSEFHKRDLTKIFHPNSTSLIVNTIEIPAPGIRAQDS